jgi:hypothetical protein
MRKVGVAPIGFFVLCLLLVVAPLAGIGPPAAENAAGSDDLVENGTLGVENGYRYNDTLAIDTTDGYNESELDTVVGRTMARVEHIRRIEFREEVPVEIITRSTFRDQVANRSSAPSTTQRLHQNAKFEGLFVVGEDTDAIAVREGNRAGGALAYYSPSEDRIVLIAKNESTPKLNEHILAQELYHALQEHRFGYTEYNQSTEEWRNANLGLIEGDANYVQYRYRQRCQRDWQCFSEEGGPSAPGNINLGLYLLGYQPYSDGPAFVEHHREAGGWSAVNAMYDDPPASTEQVIHPEKYGADEPQTVSVPDRSSGAWRVLNLPDTFNYAVFGEAGVAAMLVYPGLESRGREQVVPLNEFYNRDSSGRVSQFDPYNYGTRYSRGWDGDKFVPYVRNDSATTNETGYVWRLTWDSPDRARAFVSGYERLLAVHDATEVAGRDGVWRIDGGPYADAFRVTRDGDTVTIVNAPTVAALSKVHEPGASGGSGGEGGGVAFDDDDGVAFASG